MKFFHTLTLILILPLLIWAKSWDWESIGGPLGGTISHLILSGDEKHIYAVGNYGGIYKSVDEGESWELAGLGGQLVNSLFSTREHILLAGVSGVEWNRHSHSLFNSVDGGNIWDSIGNLLTCIKTFTQNKEGHLFAGMALGPDAIIKAPSSTTKKRQLGYPGLFKSTDLGHNWEHIGFENEPIYTLCTDEDSIMYLGGKGVYRSMDSGITWDLLGLNDMNISIIKTNEQGVLCAGTSEGDIYQSTDQGDSWDLYLSWSYSFPVRNIVFGNNDTIFVGTNNGVFLSSTPDVGWISYGLEGYKVRSLLILPNHDLIAGTEKYGIFKYSDQSRDWTSQNDGLTNTDIPALISLQNDLLFISDATNNNGYWYHTKDNICRKIDSLSLDVIADAISYGDTSIIVKTSTGMYQLFLDNRHPKSLGLSDKEIFSIAKDEEDNLFACSRGLYKSTDGGINWEFQGEAFYMSSIDFYSQDTILAAGGGGVHYSIDDGKTWESIYPYTMFVSSVTSINGYIFATDNMMPMIVRSSDGGQNWEEYHIPELEKLILIKSTNNGVVFVAGNQGMAYTEDYGETWEIIEFDKLLKPRINCIEWDQSGNIYIGTKGNGVFSSYQPQLVKVEEPHVIPKKWKLYHNYPNPFNPTTTISYKLPKSSFIKLNIYNINGQLINNLVEKQQDAGYHQVKWNAVNMPSGIYLYKIQSEEFISVKKCLLIK